LHWSLTWSLSVSLRLASRLGWNHLGRMTGEHQFVVIELGHHAEPATQGGHVGAQGGQLHSAQVGTFELAHPRLPDPHQRGQLMLGQLFQAPKIGEAVPRGDHFLVCHHESSSGCVVAHARRNFMFLGFAVSRSCSARQ
jgi:hypothetical protein